MSEVVFTMPGKLGDAVHQWPIAWWWARETGKRFTLWLDENSCRPLKPLFEAQPCVEKVEYKKGVENYHMGGQPFHFDLPTKDYEGRNIYHLGFRSFPQRQLTLETLANAKVPVEVSQDDLAETPCFEVPPVDKVPLTKQGAPVYLDLAGRRILLLHGQAVYAHTRSSPDFWRFLARIRHELESLFDEIVFVGSERDREVGTRTYPGWASFDDGGSFLELARLMSKAKAVMGVGSSVVALAGALKVGCIRVHDPIGEHPKVIWDNLGSNQLNRTEVELRKDWPEWRDRWLKAGVSGV